MHMHQGSIGVLMNYLHEPGRTYVASHGKQRSRRNNINPPGALACVPSSISSSRPMQYSIPARTPDRSCVHACMEGKPNQTKPFSRYQKIVGQVTSMIEFWEKIGPCQPGQLLPSWLPPRAHAKYQNMISYHTLGHSSSHQLSLDGAEMLISGADRCWQVDELRSPCYQIPFNKMHNEIR